MTLALTIDQLACIRAHRVVFRDVALAAEAGAFVSVEGPNGSGKTSLLRMIAGFLPPAAGTIGLHTGHRSVIESEDRAPYIGWLGHQDGIKPQLTVRVQLAFWAELYGASLGADAALEAFGLTALAHHPGQYLSAGQKRRVGLARLALSGRPLWLLDEPLAALDADGKALVVRTIASHCAAGGIVIAATHESLGLEGTVLHLGGEA